MQPKLRDINEFIKSKRLKQVKSIKKYLGNKIDDDGLFSEVIFGRQGSRERRIKFGYIDLGINIIHPEAWGIVTRISPSFIKCIKETDKFFVKEGILIEDSEGKSGLNFFIESLPKLKLDLYSKKNKTKIKSVDYVKKNLKLIIINKFLILPAGIRDIMISKTSGKTMIQSSDVNNLYENIIKQSNSIVNSENIPKDILEPIATAIQRNCNEVNTWIKNRIKGKNGVIRGGMFKKVTDYSGRLVVAGDPSLKLGYIGMPWQVALIIHEPFAINYILYKDKTGIPLIQEELKIENQPDITDIKRLLKKAKDIPNEIMPQLKEYLITVAKEITKDKQIIYKRDPVENRDSWLSAYVRIDLDGYIIKLNPFDFARTGGDCDGDTYVIYSLLTKEAQEEAKQKMNPRHNKKMWTSVTNSINCHYSLTLDASTAVFLATKK